MYCTRGEPAGCFGRELTKRFEEFRRGTLAELLAYYEEHEPRGEFVLVVAGAGTEEASREEEQPQDPVALCHQFMAEGLSKKEAMRQTAKALGLSRRDVYAALLAADTTE